MRYRPAQGSANSMKGHLVNTLSFEGHMGCVTTAQLCHGRMKAHIDNMSVNEYGHAPVKLLGKTGIGLDLGHSWLTLT